MPDTSLLHDIPYKMLLTIVRRDDRDLVRRVPNKAHIHVDCHDVFGLSKVLIKVRVGLRLALALMISHINKLIVKLEPGFGRERALIHCSLSP